VTGSLPPSPPSQQLHPALPSLLTFQSRRHRDVHVFCASIQQEPCCVMQGNSMFQPRRADRTALWAIAVAFAFFMTGCSTAAPVENWILLQPPSRLKISCFLQAETAWPCLWVRSSLSIFFCLHCSAVVSSGCSCIRLSIPQPTLLTLVFSVQHCRHMRCPKRGMVNRAFERCARLLNRDVATRPRPGLIRRRMQP
jgi:hypothetical protein